jgi:hypothetical protein
MADIDRLADELANDPLVRGYSTMTDQEVADSLNAPNRQYYVRVPSHDLLEWSGSNNRLDAVEQAHASGSTHIAMVDALVDAGVWGQSDKDAIIALGERYQTRAQELGLLGRSPEVGPAHVAQARS